MCIYGIIIVQHAHGGAIMAPRTRSLGVGEKKKPFELCANKMCTVNRTSDDGLKFKRFRSGVERIGSEEGRGEGKSYFLESIIGILQTREPFGNKRVI